jgi:hypothetical protein
MQRAWQAATGFPSSCSSAAWMLGFVTPPDVSKSFKLSRLAGEVDVPLEPRLSRNSS